MVTCDHLFHVATGTVIHWWAPQVDGQTVWVILSFGLAAIALVALAPALADAAPACRLRMARELAVLTLIYAASGWFGQAHPEAVLVAFAGLFALRLLVSGERRALLGVAVVLALVGPAFESLAWLAGMFEYAQPDVIGVPWWLFAFYANGAWATRELGALLRGRTPERVPAV
jgi:hypothetical protein